MNEQTTTDLTLPSGNTISADTWAAILAAGDWRGILDPRMYGEADQEHMDALLPARGVEHMFQPFVCLTPRPDGRFAVDFDWSDAYLGENTEDGWNDRGNGKPACDAMDAWVRTLPAQFVIPASDLDSDTRAPMPFPRPSLADVEQAAQEAADTANGDSNDAEIEALQNALDLALHALGLRMPEPRDTDD